MRIKSIRVQGFRSYQDFSLTLDEPLVTLVGENNVGKSTLGIAIQRLIIQLQSASSAIDGTDLPYGIHVSTLIEILLELLPEDIERLVAAFVLSGGPTASTAKRKDWPLRQGRDIVLTMTSPPEYTDSAQPLVRWGQLYFRPNRLAIGHKELLKTGGTGVSWDEYDPSMSAESPSTWTHLIALPIDISSLLYPTLRDSYKIVSEFRARPVGQRTDALEAPTGVETASVLLNLKNHSDRRVRDRYERVRETFHTLMPRFQIDAIEQSPGQSTPEVQFWEEGRTNPLSISLVSAGVTQVLSLITTLVSREELVVFLEHPEEHLHPHSMRFLRKFLRGVAERNQIIVVTHDPHFVDPSSPRGLRRFWWAPDEGTKAFGPDPSMSEIKSNQILTALRQLGNREMVFARSVVLVEDETQQDFLIAVAPTLDYDVDAEGVSIIAVGGHDGFRPFYVLLDALRVPYVSLRDLNWGTARSYPPDRFFSFGKEVEEYLDEHGLAAERQAVIQDVGTNKRRVGAVLGSRLKKEQVPEIFDRVLKAAVDSTRQLHRL